MRQRAGAWNNRPRRDLQCLAGPDRSLLATSMPFQEDEVHPPQAPPVRCRTRVRLDWPVVPPPPTPCTFRDWSGVRRRCLYLAVIRRRWSDTRRRRFGRSNSSPRISGPELLRCRDTVPVLVHVATAGV